MRHQTCLFLLLGFIFTAPLNAQWATLSTGVSADLYTVEMVDDLTVFAAGQNIFIKSLDGGQNWTSIPFVDTNNQPIGTLSIHDLHFFNSTEGIAVGVRANIFQVILRTTDGGLHWTILSSINDPNNWKVGYKKVYFIDTQTGWCVGSSGRMMKTVNGGQNWTVIAPALNLYSNLLDVHFVDAQTGFLAAEINYNTFSIGHYLKTSNGGQSWQTLFEGGPPLTDIFFTNAQIGYLASAFYFVRINDGLTNATEALFPDQDQEAPLELRFFSPDNGYALTSNSVRKTTTGGQFWETSKLPQTAENDLQHFDWSNDGLTGFVVGKKGKAYKTSAGGAPYQPLAFFTLPPNGVFCPDTLIECLNPAPANDYNSSWYIDGALYATTNDLAVSFPDYGTTHTIMLVVSDSTVTDTFSRSITMEQQLPDFDINLEWITATPYCAGSKLQFQISNPVPQQSYFVFVNGQYHTQQLALNSNPIVFNTPSLTDTSLISVEVHLQSICESKIIAGSLVADIIPVPNIYLNWEADSACLNTPTQLTIYQSEANMQYQLLLNDIPYSPVVPGNGGDLIITTYPLTYYGNYKIEASFQGLCAQKMSLTQSIEIEDFDDLMDTAQTFAVVGQPIQIIHPTYGLESVQWNFGATANPQQSTDLYPTVVFNSAGSFPYTYQYQSKEVCTGEKTGHFEVFDQASDLPGLFCPPKALSKLGWETILNNHTILDTKTDQDGNILVTGGAYQKVGSTHTMNLFLRKYDPTGELLWEKNTDPNSSAHSKYQSSYGTALSTDPDGNIYLAGSYSAEKAVILGQTFITPTLYGQGFIIKLTPQGQVLWTVHLHIHFDSQLCIPSDLIYSEYDQELHLVFRASDWIAEFPGGSIVEENAQDARIWYLRLNTAGNYIQHFRMGSMYSGVTLPGLYHPVTGTTHYGALYTYTSPEIYETANGNLVFTGVFSVLNDLIIPTFGNYPAVPVNTDIYNANHFVAVYDRKISDWTNAFCTHAIFNPGNSYWSPQSTITKDNTLVTGFGLINHTHSYLAPPLTTLSIQVKDGITMTTANRSFLSKFDLSGNLLWNTIGSQINVHSLQSDTSGNIWMLSGYTGAAGFYGTGNSRLGIAALGAKDILLSQFNPDGNLVGLHNYGTVDIDQPTGFTVDKFGRVITIASTGLNNLYSVSPAKNQLLLLYTPGDSCLPPVSASEPGTELALSFSPNPFTESLTISLEEPAGEKLQLSLFDAWGHKLFVQSLLPDVSGKVSLSPQLSPGVYYVQVRSSKGLYVGKVVKM